MSETATAPDAGKQQAECVYLGRRTLSDGKLGEAWIPLALFDQFPDQAEAHSSLFKFKRFDRRVIGGVYLCTVKLGDNGSLNSLAVGAFQRQLDRSAMLTAWRASDTAADQRKRQADLEKRLAEDDGLEQELRNLRIAWLAVPPGDRLAFEMMVLRRLRSPKR
jgi:hypothetical protein